MESHHREGDAPSKKRFDEVPGTDRLDLPHETVEKVYFLVAWVGVLERIVYVASWLYGHPEAIAIILALKAAPSLKEWSEHQSLGRAMFNKWLIGNLLSVLLAVLTAELVQMLADWVIGLFSG